MVASTRFMCPGCGAAVTPWLRALTLAEAVCRSESETWVMPGGYFVRREDPIVAGAYVATLAGHPWLMAPQDTRWLRPHPDAQRWVGCCGMSFRGGEANLVCACGTEVGIGYRDCCNPHWYALGASVGREALDSDDGENVDSEDLVGGARRLVAAAEVPAQGCVAKSDGAQHDDVSSWRGVRRLTEVSLTCAGGAEAPALLVRSPQLPAQGPLILPLPWAQLVRLLVLAETPWGSPEVPMTWRSAQVGAPTVQVSLQTGRVLLTAWAGEVASAVLISVDAWAAAWTRLRGESRGAGVKRGE